MRYHFVVRFPSKRSAGLALRHWPMLERKDLITVSRYDGRTLLCSTNKRCAYAVAEDLSILCNTKVVAYWYVDPQNIDLSSESISALLSQCDVFGLHLITRPTLNLSDEECLALLDL